MASIILVIGFVAIVASIWSVCALFALRLTQTEARIREELGESLRSLVSPGPNGEPSALAVYTDQAASLLAARLMQQIKTSLAGVASGESKAAVAEAEGALAGVNPTLAMLSQLIPKRIKSKLLSSPAFVGQLSMLGKGNGQTAQPSSNLSERIRRQGG